MSRSPGALGIALLAAVAAVVFVLSPLTVLFIVAIVAVVHLATRDLDPDDRQLVTRVVVIAIGMRVLAVAILFLLANHAQVPFRTFFADEEYFIKRSLWLRNLALGRPLHALDLEYAFEPFNSARYVYLLAFVQVLVGPAPYGLHLVSILLYVSGVLLLYREARAALGRMPALFGLSILLFLPSLFAWSVSVLKEPLMIFISALAVALAVRLARCPSWTRRALAAASIVVLAVVDQSIRPGGALFVVASVAGGLALGFVATRPRLIIAAVLVTPVALGAAFRTPDVQLKTYTAIQSAARQHWGAIVVSRGHSYRLLDPRFYRDVNEVSSLEFAETARFLARGVAAYVFVPLPWDASSRAAVAFLPEQIVWYVLVALVPVGVIGGFRRDPMLTGLLVAHAAFAVAAVAFVDGNVGTLVRHRGLALPYLAWLSGVGACDLLARVSSPTHELANSPIRQLANSPIHP
jgi:hypothetical protein